MNKRADFIPTIMDFFAALFYILLLIIMLVLVRISHSQFNYDIDMAMSSTSASLTLGSMLNVPVEFQGYNTSLGELIVVYSSYLGHDEMGDLIREAIWQKMDELSKASGLYNLYLQAYKGKGQQFEIDFDQTEYVCDLRVGRVLLAPMLDSENPMPVTVQVSYCEN